MTARVRSSDSLAVEYSGSSPVSDATVDEIHNQLARYAVRRTTSKPNQPPSKKAKHDAVLALIGDDDTPDTLPISEIRLRSPPTDEGSDANDSEEGDGDEDESHSGRTTDSSSSSSSSDSSSPTESGGEDVEPLDDILGPAETSSLPPASPPSQRAVAAHSSSSELSSGGLHTMSEIPNDSPLRYLNEILDRRKSGTSFDAALVASGSGGPSSGSPIVAQDSPGTHLYKALQVMISGEARGAHHHHHAGAGEKRMTPPKEILTAPPAARARRNGAAGAAKHEGRGSMTMLAQLEAASSSLSSTSVSLAGASPLVAEEVSFRRGAEIGKGGFGIVFQAILDDGRLAAVKQLPAADRKGINKEMRVMCNLPPHPHCVQYLGVKRTKHHVYMVMEYVSGGSIANLRRTVGPLQEPAARRYAHMTLLGIHHLHTNKIIHQDIKGANVLLDERGSAKIADFGCIKDLSVTHSTLSEASTQGGAGTPLWMAPEVCRGEYPSPKSDVWSFGCFMLEMLSESGVPWNLKPGTTLQAAAYAIGSATNPPPFPEHVSPALLDFLSKCLVINPTRRATVEDLLQHPFFTKVELQTSPMRSSTYALAPWATTTVQSVASAATLASDPSMVTQSSFKLEAASDDDDVDDGVIPARAAPAKHQTPVAHDAARPGVVWRSTGALHVDPRASQKKATADEKGVHGRV